MTPPAPKPKPDDTPAEDAPQEKTADTPADDAPQEKAADGKVKLTVLSHITVTDGDVGVKPTYYEAGDTIEVPEAEVDRLIACGAAEK